MLRIILLSIFLINFSYAEELEDTLTHAKEEKTDSFLEEILNQKVELNSIHGAILSNPDKTSLEVQYNRKTIAVALEPSTNTSIELPENESITHFTLGDSVSFEGQPINDKKRNKFLVKVKHSGAATTLHLFGSSGSTYIFYLYGIKSASKDIPKYTVYVKNSLLEVSVFNDSEGSSEKSGLSNERYDFLPSSNDTGILNGNYHIYGDEEIAPYAVYDNGEFTYFDFRKNLKAGRYPNLYKISDKFDSQLIVEKRDGFIIAKSLSKEGWTLINGNKTVCVKPGGKSDS